MAIHGDTKMLGTLPEVFNDADRAARTAGQAPSGNPARPMRLYQLSLTLPMLKQAIEHGRQARTAEAGREAKLAPQGLGQGQTRTIAFGRARRGSAAGMQSTMLGLMVPQGRQRQPGQAKRNGSTAFPMQERLTPESGKGKN